MCRLIVSVLVLGLLVLAPLVAYADAPGSLSTGGTTASDVAFDTWMTKLATYYSLLAPFAGYFNPLTADDNWNGILDSTEFALIAAISNNTSHPLHETVHEAYKTNMAQAQIDCATLYTLAKPIKVWAAGYLTLADGSYTDNGLTGAAREVATYEGSIGFVAGFFEAARDYSKWNTGAPNLSLYNVSNAAILSCAGDADSDGVANGLEFYGQSMNRAAWVTAALDSGTTDSGTGPGDCGGNNEECMSQTLLSTMMSTFTYVPATGKLYLLVGTPRTWTEGEAFANSLDFGSGPSHLIGINSADENALALTMRNAIGETCWTGGNDVATEGDWKWASDGISFWSGKGSGATPPGFAVDGQYTNWNGTGEPNDSGGNEDFLELRDDGTWNDNGPDKTHPIIIEATGTFADSDSDGTPDVLEDNDGDGYPDTFADQFCGPGDVIQKPSAAFSADVTSGVRPLAVQFTDASLPGDEAITTWAWDFGDGGTSAVASPSHTYTTAGTYTVALTVTSSVGSDTETKTGYIVVSGPAAPVAAFSGTPLSGAYPHEVQFTDASDEMGAAITAWAWTFGDGGTSTLQNPSHTYTVDGTYTVSLTVTNENGSDIETKTGYVTVTIPAYHAVIAQNGGWVEANADLSLSVIVTDATGAVTYLWLKNGSPFDRAGTDETAAVLVMNGLVSGDSGSYSCQVTDESKGVTVTPPIVITVVAEGSLPAAGLFGLLILAGASILGARSALRKK